MYNNNEKITHKKYINYIRNYKKKHYSILKERCKYSNKIVLCGLYLRDYKKWFIASNIEGFTPLMNCAEHYAITYLINKYKINNLDKLGKIDIILYTDQKYKIEPCGNCQEIIKKYLKNSKLYLFHE